MQVATHCVSVLLVVAAQSAAVLDGLSVAMVQHASGHTLYFSTFSCSCTISWSFGRFECGHGAARKWPHNVG